MMINCTKCGVMLTGGTDTFGDVNWLLCQTCFWEDLEATDDQITIEFNIKGEIESLGWLPCIIEHEQKEEKLDT